MLLAVTTTHRPATDLGYLLHKHPDRVQSFSLPFGEARVFYPEATEQRCTAALLLDVDPVGLVRRGRGVSSFALAEYVNDRPYVASSFLSVALVNVFKSAMAGTCEGSRIWQRRQSPWRLGCPLCRRGAASRSYAACSSRSATRWRSRRSRSTRTTPSGATVAMSDFD